MEEEAGQGEALKDIGSTFEGKHPSAVLRWAHDAFPAGSVLMATGFGAEGVVLVDLLMNIGRNIPVFYIDTDVLFPETYRLRRELEARYGLEFVRAATAVSFNDQAARFGDRLWERDPDQCCHIRKVLPLREILRGKQGWITAIRRDQSPSRANAEIVEWDANHGLMKINPLAGWTKDEVWRYTIERDLPYNPLYDQGYASIGCTHCTTPVAPGEDERAGRWRGRVKTECGLHGRYERMLKQPLEDEPPAVEPLSREPTSS